MLYVSSQEPQIDADYLRNSLKSGSPIFTREELPLLALSNCVDETHKLVYRRIETILFGVAEDVEGNPVLFTGAGEVTVMQL